MIVFQAAQNASGERPPPYEAIKMEEKMCGTDEF